MGLEARFILVSVSWNCVSVGVLGSVMLAVLKVVVIEVNSNAMKRGAVLRSTLAGRTLTPPGSVDFSEDRMWVAQNAACP